IVANSGNLDSSLAALFIIGCSYRSALNVGGQSGGIDCAYVTARAAQIGVEHVLQAYLNQILVWPNFYHEAFGLIPRSVKDTNNLLWSLDFNSLMSGLLVIAS